MKTVCIQIGNFGNKLLQHEWAEFCDELIALCSHYGDIHFNGGLATNSYYQNFCVVVDTQRAHVLRVKVSELGNMFKQDSVAWLEGFIDFI